MNHRWMTSRERLRAALFSQPVDRLPWAPLMDGYFVSSLPKQGFPDMDLISAARYTRCDLLERHVFGPVEEIAGVAIRVEERPGGRRTYYETPVGSAYQENRYTGK